jgi:hypothetical protein
MIDFKNISRDTVFWVVSTIVWGLVSRYFIDDERFYISIAILLILGVFYRAYKENTKGG